MKNNNWNSMRMKRIFVNPYTIFILFMICVISLCRYVYLGKYLGDYGRFLLLEWNTLEQNLGYRLHTTFIAQFCIHLYLIIGIISQQFVWVHNHFYMIRHHSIERYIYSLIKSISERIVLLVSIQYLCLIVICSIWDNYINIILNIAKESMLILIICILYYVLKIVCQKEVPIYMILPVLVVLTDAIIGTTLITYSIDIYQSLIYIMFYIVVGLLLYYILYKKSNITIWR